MLQLQDNPVEQALVFVYPVYQRIVTSRGLEAANLWLYEVKGKFDRLSTFLNSSEKEALRDRVRGQYNLTTLEVYPELETVINRPRKELSQL